MRMCCEVGKEDFWRLVRGSPALINGLSASLRNPRLPSAFLSIGTPATPMVVAIRYGRIIVKLLAPVVYE